MVKENLRRHGLAAFQGLPECRQTALQMGAPALTSSSIITTLPLLTARF